MHMCRQQGDSANSAHERSSPRARHHAAPFNVALGQDQHPDAIDAAIARRPGSSFARMLASESE
jgi:hypothetical protein